MRALLAEEAVLNQNMLAITPPMWSLLAEEPKVNNPFQFSKSGQTYNLFPIHLIMRQG